MKCKHEAECKSYLPAIRLADRTNYRSIPDECLHKEMCQVFEEVPPLPECDKLKTLSLLVYQMQKDVKTMYDEIDGRLKANGMGNAMLRKDLETHCNMRTMRGGDA
jgi:hypothetical protein